jgi:hypothetical protein
LSDRVRRLEVIQRISRRLQTLTSVEAIGEAVATETRDLIAYDSCRVHIWHEDGGGVILPLIGFYGELPNRDQVPVGALDLRLGEGIIGWVAQHGEPLLIADAMSDPRAKHIPGTPQTSESLLAVPLATDERVKGVIAMGKGGADQFQDDDMQLLVILANAAAVALENAETRLSLARQARTDAVTGLPHHGPFQVDLAAALALADQGAAPAALLLLDLDSFRSYNERPACRPAMWGCNRWLACSTSWWSRRGVPRRRRSWKRTTARPRPWPPPIASAATSSRCCCAARWRPNGPRCAWASASCRPSPVSMRTTRWRN